MEIIRRAGTRAQNSTLFLIKSSVSPLATEGLST